VKLACVAAPNMTATHASGAGGRLRRAGRAAPVARRADRAHLREALALVGEPVAAAYRTPGPWPERVRSALGELLAVFDERPGLARFCVVESLAGDATLLARRAQVLAAVAEALEEGRELAPRGAEPPPLTSEGVVGAVAAILHARLSERPPPELRELLGQLTAVVVAPYLGPRAAREELARAATDPSAPSPRARMSMRGTLAREHMRVTYRTLRVLAALSGHPGSSNSEIAAVADIKDRAQISRLLARLQGLGLIDNAQGRSGGRPRNAWELTVQGRELLRASESGPLRGGG
jgi:DNA-binding MarR family transcriptional regulator